MYMKTLAFIVLMKILSSLYCCLDYLFCHVCSNSFLLSQNISLFWKLPLIVHSAFNDDILLCKSCFCKDGVK